MKVSELIEILNKIPSDCDVKYVTFDSEQERYRFYSISRDCDIGYSDKIALLTGDELD